MRKPRGRARRTAEPAVAVPLRQQRERSNPYALWFEDDDASCVKVGFDRRQVGKKECDLLVWASLGAPTKQHYRGRALAPIRKERSEVGVGGYDHAALALGPLEDRFVARALQSIVTDVNGIMTRRA